ncbi:FliM/FliN family flagellar motor switch protein [Roseiconus lacunae]|uniref:FliM/FliN family flagellar motor switch protein n=1 Tax=Roseiconus lacunae TaxID=2605694 RepID=UPI001E2C3360|nr:FliM/FliN family flagellar motor switch protein [Roseiconus lacunae]MCD0457870.1 FliM/FliN family flagellar motor switch protein [Roseiconus lacunae]
MIDAVALELEELTVEQRAVADLVGVARRIPISFGEHQCEVTLGGGTQQSLSRLSVNLRGERSGVVTIHFDCPELIALIDEWLGESLVDLPEQVASAVLNVWFDAALETLEQMTGETLQISGFTKTFASPSCQFETPFTLEIDDHLRVAGRICFDPEAETSIRQFVQQGQPSATHDLGDLNVNVPIQIGRSWLTYDELMSLSVHDVVLIDDASEFDSDLVTLGISPRASATCKLVGDTLVVESFARHSPGFSDDQGLSEHGNTRFPVDVCPGFAELSLVELETLTVDSVLMPVAYPKRKVRLVLGGCVVADGQLVRCGDRLGIRLLNKYLSCLGDPSLAATQI